MLRLVNSNQGDINFISSFGLKMSENINIIYYNSIKVGVVEYTRHREQVYIAFISILPKYRRLGIGKKVINLLSVDGEYEIYGDAIPQSVEFWKSLDAILDTEEINTKDSDTDNCIPFHID